MTENTNITKRLNADEEALFQMDLAYCEEYILNLPNWLGQYKYKVELGVMGAVPTVFEVNGRLTWRKSGSSTHDSDTNKQLICATFKDREAPFVRDPHPVDWLTKLVPKQFTQGGFFYNARCIEYIPQRVYDIFALFKNALSDYSCKTTSVPEYGDVALFSEVWNALVKSFQHPVSPILSSSYKGATRVGTTVRWINVPEKGVVPWMNLTPEFLSCRRTETIPNSPNSNLIAL